MCVTPMLSQYSTTQPNTHHHQQGGPGPHPGDSSECAGRHRHSNHSCGSKLHRNNQQAGQQTGHYHEPQGPEHHVAQKSTAQSSTTQQKQHIAAQLTWRMGTHHGPPF